MSMSFIVSVRDFAWYIGNLYHTVNLYVSFDFLIVQSFSHGKIGFFLPNRSFFLPIQFISYRIAFFSYQFNFFSYQITFFSY